MGAALISTQGWEGRVRAVERCRICGNPELRPVIDLGSQCLAGLFDDGRPQNRLTTPIPLQVVCCSGDCGLIQLRHTVPPDVMFQDYGYRSGLNNTMRRHLENLSAEIESKLALKAGDIVVDIGANDGTSLLAYREPGLMRVGFEPSDAARDAEARGVRIIRAFFNNRSGAGDFQKEFPRRKAKVITSIAMFYDIEDPLGFCRQIHEILEEDGLWVMELHYWGDMLKNTAFDAICHEHLGYYSLSTLDFLARKTGFRLYDVRFNDSNGGSIRCFLVKEAGSRQVPEENAARIQKALEEENQSGVMDPARLGLFRQNAEKIRAEIRAILQSAVGQGKRVYGYGASTKGNVLLQYCGVGPREIIAIADKNAKKHGRKAPGTGIPICSEEEMRAARPDFLLILPWHFLSEFLKREEPLRAQGTRFIIPFPEARVL